MSILPSSSTGVLFALVYNNTVPLSVAVVTQGEQEAVSSFSNTSHVYSLHAFTHTKAQTDIIKLCHVIALPAPEPASVLGRRLRGYTGLAHVVLPGPADSTAECDCYRNPDLSQLLQFYLHEL